MEILNDLIFPRLLFSRRQAPWLIALISLINFNTIEQLVPQPQNEFGQCIQSSQITGLHLRQLINGTLLRYLLIHENVIVGYDYLTQVQHKQQILFTLCSLASHLIIALRCIECRRVTNCFVMLVPIGVWVCASVFHFYHKSVGQCRNVFAFTLLLFQV